MTTLPARTSATSAARVRFQPRVDIREGDDAFTLVADLPGVSSDGLHLQFEDGLLTLQATVDAPAHEISGSLFSEWASGDFYRTFRISPAVDAEHIEARLEDGLLTLRLPKASQHLPRSIPVQAR